MDSLAIKNFRDILIRMEAAITAQLAMTRQNAAMGMLKSSAQADKAIVNMLQQTIENAPNASGRGSIVNITA